MNKNEIVTAVSKNNNTLVLVSPGWGERVSGFYLRKTDQSLVKLHGKSANAAVSELIRMDGIGRSYSKAVMTKGSSKPKNVFVREYAKVDFE